MTNAPRCNRQACSHMRWAAGTTTGRLLFSFYEDVYRSRRTRSRHRCVRRIRARLSWCPQPGRDARRAQPQLEGGNRPVGKHHRRVGNIPLRRQARVVRATTALPVKGLDPTDLAVLAEPARAGADVLVAGDDDFLQAADSPVEIVS